MTAESLVAPKNAFAACRVGDWLRDRDNRQIGEFALRPLAPLRGARVAMVAIVVHGLRVQAADLPRARRCHR